MLVDAHCHLNQLTSDQYEGGLEGILFRAKENGVEHILCPAVSLSDFQEIMELIKKYSFLSAAVALHPSDTEESEVTVDELVSLASHERVVGIGETGLDYHYLDLPIEQQCTRFQTHIQSAVEVHKPLIVHMREASDDCFRLLKEGHADRVGGMMHCFTGTWEDAQKAMDLGFYISFSGIVTFRNANDLREVAKRVPLDRLLIETDSPYLTPEPMRRLPNEPSYVRMIAAALASLRGESFDTIANSTTHNFFQLFHRASPCLDR
ncbi:MAG: TatD family hydrolase [Gammaproteobacteria bacterium]|nr:TatD family hydrolase [Gammaproteobacteria bacterium]MBU1558923.1 TatD family hydrolase [Gammaproteobacteria bacterium]MBU1629284.1 TatD family hydrolase [Gammaproteobacteria bacterium]MBU1926554.1 TatD family hydrolase [Gammaproteobacteria bacterium]MBU2546310.1 TatD family hydrolase [Gammaproteobacteria bacterium]